MLLSETDRLCDSRSTWIATRPRRSTRACSRRWRRISRRFSATPPARGMRSESRRTIAEAINAQPDEIIFTSGATESDNLAIKGTARRHEGGHIITAATEHKAVLDPCRSLSQQGFRVTCLPVDPRGFISLDALAAALTPDTILVSIMHGNNEIGTIQDIAAIGALCREHGVPFHTDATQTIGKLRFDAQAMHVDMASLTAHKMYGPK